MDDEMRGTRKEDGMTLRQFYRQAREIVGDDNAYVSVEARMQEYSVGGMVRQGFVVYTSVPYSKRMDEQTTPGAALEALRQFVRSEATEDLDLENGESETKETENVV